MQRAAFQPPAPFLAPSMPRILQWPVIFVMALIVSNVIMKGPLPFAVGYQFPWRDFLTLLVAIFLIMEANKYVYFYLDNRLPFFQEINRRLFWQCIGSFLVTLVLFVVIHMLRAALLRESLQLKDFIFYGFVAFSISIALNGVHIIGYLVRLVKYKEAALQESAPSPEVPAAASPAIAVPSASALPTAVATVAAPSKTLAVEMGNRTLMMDADSISWWHSRAGAVTLIRVDGATFTTNYASFAEIADRLPVKEFFHLNRQIIAHRSSIDSIQTGQNGQLIVQLKTGQVAARADAQPGAQAETVVVSRYKRDAFREWMDMRFIL